MIDEIIDYRRERAKEALKDAEQILESGSLFSAEENKAKEWLDDAKLFIEELEALIDRS